MKSLFDTFRINVALKNSEVPSVDNLLRLICQKFPAAENYIDWNRLIENHAYVSRSYEDLKTIDKGGFDHAEVGRKYGSAQLNKNRIVSREIGYKGIFHLLQRTKKWSGEDVLLDVLAGNGTVERMLRQLFDVAPNYVGNDVSLEMVMQGIEDGKLVFYSDLRSPVLARDFADYCVSAYGTHHVGQRDRQEFVSACYARLKPGATLVLQDFEENSITASWYDTCIDRYRIGGHQYPHFTKHELTTLLREAGFRDVELQYLYDPFIFTAPANCDDHVLQQDFYRYLVDLFALSKLHAVDASEGWRGLEKILKPYFRVEEGKVSQALPLRTLGTDTDLLATELVVRRHGERKLLIAPRVAIAVVGTK